MNINNIHMEYDETGYGNVLIWQQLPSVKNFTQFRAGSVETISLIKSFDI